MREMSDEAVIKKLTALRGIGMWTAKMYLIFVLDRQDVLPFEMVRFCNLIVGFIKRQTSLLYR